MTQTLLHQLLATAEKIDGPQSWIHLCLTAAAEAYHAVVGDTELTAEDREALRELLDGRRNEAKRWVITHLLQGDDAEIEYTRLPPFYSKATLRGSLEEHLDAKQQAALSRLLDGSKHATKADANAAASAAYRNTLPPITNRRSVQSFVACVAAGVLRGYLTAKDANSLLYAAQAALSAFPKRNARKGGK